MTTFELLAVLPATQDKPPDTRLRFVSSSGFTAVLADRATKVMILPQSRKAALQAAAQRQAWLEACMPLGTVIPFLPDCTIKESDVAPLIAANRPLFAALATRLRDKVQFQITVSWDPAGVLDRFRNTPELSDLFAGGVTTQAELAHAIAALADRLRGEIHHSLQDTAAEVLHLPLAPDMLTNTVVLQRSDQLSQLDRVIENIDHIWTEGLQIRQIGPAPAASFVRLDPESISEADIAKALQSLGLQQPGTSDVITKARRDTLLQAPALAADIRRNAEILQAALRVGPGLQPFRLCVVRSDDQTTPSAKRQVA